MVTQNLHLCQSSTHLFLRLRWGNSPGKQSPDLERIKSVGEQRSLKYEAYQCAEASEAQDPAHTSLAQVRVMVVRVFRRVYNLEDRTRNDRNLKHLMSIRIGELSVNDER